MISNLITKFKNLICDLFAPTLLIITLISLPLGPIYFPRIHIIGLSIFFAVYLINSVCQVIKFLVSYKRIVNTIKRYPNQSKNYYDPSDDASPTLTADSSSTSSNSLVDELVDETTSFLPLTIPKRTLMHCFVIPNYKEPLGLLRDTVIRLSKHRYAQTQYTIILAMEASEADSDLKGNMLKEELQHMFREFIVTVHPVNVPGEARGKASNVNYAVRQSYRYLTQERDYSLQDLLVTVSDSDSGIPELYTTKLEEAYHTTHNPNTVIYASPTFFSRNPHNVPAVVRIADIMWSAMVIQNLANLRGMIFPCSNYSLSMELAKKVGWWDPYDEAVGEDLHMFLKCFWNTNTVARGVPVYVPINMCHVEVEGFFANIKARYVQARRHYSAIPDLSYTLKHFFSTSFPTPTTDIMTEWDPTNRSWFGRFIDRIMVTYLIIEAQMLPMISGWVMVFAIPLIELAVFLPPESTTNPLAVDPFYKVLYQVVKYTSFALPTSLVIQAISYHTLHLKIEKFLHKPPPGKERTHRNLLDFLWLPVLAVFLMTIPSTVACFMRLFNFNLEYITSEKNFDEESSTHD